MRGQQHPAVRELIEFYEVKNSTLLVILLSLSGPDGLINDTVIHDDVCFCYKVHDWWQVVDEL